MADEKLTDLLSGAIWPNGYSTSNALLVVDVTDASMAPSGTDKGITVANFISQYGIATLTGSGASLTGITGSQITGNISGDAASITGSITTSQVSDLGSWAGSTSITKLGTIATGTVPGANVSGNIAGSAGGLTANIAESQVTSLVTDLAAKSPLAGSTSIVTLGTIATGTVPAANVSGLAASATTNALNASNISSGTLGVARGGTGLGTLTAHSVVLGEGTSTPGFATIGTAGNVLTDNGSSADPTFQAIPNATYVFASLAGNYTITGSYANIAYSGTNLQVILPAAGTYLLFGSMRTGVSISGTMGQYVYVVVRFYDATLPGVVASSYMLPVILYAATTGPTYSTQQTAGWGPIPYTVSVPTTIVAQAIYATTGTATALIQADSNGYPSITATRMY